jgi:hypothetical protein
MVGTLFAWWGFEARASPVSLARVVLIAAAFADVVLVLGGVGFAPEALGSVTGVGIIVADVGLLVAIAVAGLAGPVSFGRAPEVVGVCLVAGPLFALCYVADLLFDFAGRPISVNPWILFVSIALAASVYAAYRTKRLWKGVVAGVWSLVLGTAIWSSGLMAIAYAFWGTRHAYGFWLRDGAVSDFHRSGQTDFALFILQDIEGAVFFHPLLSVVLGATCGVIGATTGLVASRVTRPA